MQPRFLNIPFIPLSIYLGQRPARRYKYTNLWKWLYRRSVTNA